MADENDKGGKPDVSANGAGPGAPSGDAPGIGGGEVPRVADLPRGGPTQDPANAPRMTVVFQFVKDLSFENPGAPKSLTARMKPPRIDIRINVTANKASETDYEVLLKLEATGKDTENNDETLFAAELVYGGLFRMTNVPENQVGLLAMVECPRILFPFARQVLGDAVRNGGFPPLLLDPIDFLALYRERVRQTGNAGITAPPPPANA